MYNLRDFNKGYNFAAPENAPKWEGVFIPMLEKLQKTLDENLEIDKDGRKYVETLIIRLLGDLVSTPFSSMSLNSPAAMIMDIEERVKRVIPPPLDQESLKRAKEIKTALTRKRSRANSLFSGHGHGHGHEVDGQALARFHQLMQKEVLGHKIDLIVATYLEAILESIATDVLQLSGRYVKNIKSKVITAQDIRTAMYVDKVLMDLFYKDVDEGPPPSAGFHSHQSFFDSDMMLPSSSQSASTGVNNGGDDKKGGETVKKKSYLEAVKEVIHEERRFFNDLNLIIKVFRDPLYPVVTPVEAATIFGNIDDIYDFCNEFLGALEDAVEVADDEESPAIAACFEEFAEGQEFDVFEKYAHFMNLKKDSDEFNEDDGREVPRFSRENLDRILQMEGVRANLAKLGHGMIDAFRYVLSRLLLLPIYHCFSYFKAIENLKALTDQEDEKETYQQAEGLLTRLKRNMDNLNLNKKRETYFLKLPGRTNPGAARTKMAEIQKSIEGWNLKDLGQSCNEFILEGPLIKLGRAGRQTERNAFLFDGLLMLCKPKWSSGTIQCDWRFKEQFVIRNIEITDQEGRGRSAAEEADYDLRSGNSSFYTFPDRPYDPNQTITSGQSLASLQPPPASPGYSDHHSVGFFGGIGHNSHNADSISTFSMSTNCSETTLMSVTSSATAIVNATAKMELANLRPRAFQISSRTKSPIVLVAKSPEEKDMWMSHLILLNTRSMMERNLDSRLLEEAKHHPLQLPDPLVYRFAVEDSDLNIIFEEAKSSSSNVPLIKGATLLKLIERLTYHKYGDPALVRTFLTTYRSFCTPTVLLNLLIERFTIPEPDFKRCMQAIHFANDELSPTSIHPPTASASVSTEPPTPTNVINGNGTVGDDTQQPTSPTSPTHSVATLAIISEFNFDEPNEQLQKDYREMLKRFRKIYVQPVQFRVLNVVRHWIDNHYYDFERDAQLLKMLNDFLSENGKHSCRNMRKLIDHIQKVLARKEKEQQSSVEASLQAFTFYNENPPTIEWHLTKDEKEFDLLTLHPVEIARQLTLLEFDLYRAVKPSELVGTEGQSGVWTKKDKQKTSPNLMKLIKHTDNFTFYLEKCIIETENFDERIAVISRIIEIMIVLQEMNNFNGVLEVVSALTSASVHRLEHTMAFLEKNSKLKKAFDEAQDLGPKNHYKKYHEKLRSINPPCVPFFGSYLTYILHIEEGNDEYLSQSNSDLASIYESDLLLNESCSIKLINFNKKRKVAAITSEIQQYQNQPYVLQVEPAIQHFLKSLDPLGKMDKNDFQNYLYNKSLEIEPRGSKQPTKYLRKWPDRNLKSPGIKLRPSNFGPQKWINSLDPLNLISNHSSNSNSNNSSHFHPTTTGGETRDFIGDTTSNSLSSISTIIAPQQSPSLTTLTPPQSANLTTGHAAAVMASHLTHYNPQYISSGMVNLNDPVFAPVMIGGGGGGPWGNSTTGTSAISAPAMTNGLSSKSPTTPSPSTSTTSFFQFSSPPPLPPKPAKMLAGGGRSSSPRSRQQQRSNGEGGDDTSTPSTPSSSSPPPLPPRKLTPSVTTGGCPAAAAAASTSGLANMVRSLSNHMNLPPPPLPPHQPIRPMDVPLSPSAASFHHQRGNSDIILSPITSNGHSSSLSLTGNGPNSPIVRRNSNLEQPLTPRRFSQGAGNGFPLPPPTPPSPTSGAVAAGVVPDLPPKPKPKPLKLSNDGCR